MIINMNDIYKIQYKCKKNYMRKYSTKSGSSIVYESSGGGNLIQIFLASMNKERKSLKYRYHEHRNSEKGGGLIFLFFQIHSCFFFLFHFLCAH